MGLRTCMLLLSSRNRLGYLVLTRRFTSLDKLVFSAFLPTGLTDRGTNHNHCLHTTKGEIHDRFQVVEHLYHTAIQHELHNIAGLRPYG